MDIKLLILIILMLAGVVLTIIGFSNTFKRKGMAKFFVIMFGVILLIYPIVGIGAQLGLYTLPSSVGNFFLSASVPSYVPTPTSGSCPAGYILSAGMCIAQSTGNNYQPTASYSTTDRFTSTALTGGTVYYKAGSNKATTTAITNTDPNTDYQYWYSNTTYYVKPFSFRGGGTNTIVNTEAYKVGGITLNGYDLIESTALASSTYNASLSSGTAKIKFTYIGSATTSNMSLGGVLVVEANNSISSINCFGEGISKTQGSKYQVTVSPSYTSNKYVIYEVDEGYDVSPDGIIGVTKTFECDFTGGTAPGAGATYYVDFIPANYYYVNSDGSFAKDVEKKLNGVTTRTGAGGSHTTFYWRA